MALKALYFQAGVATVVALLFLAKNIEFAAAAAIGGFAVVLGGLLMALRTFSAGVASPGTVLANLLIGVAIKWIVIVGALYLALAYFGLPALPLLVGLVASTVAFFIHR
jgi:ATP synthase protein I